MNIGEEGHYAKTGASKTRALSVQEMTAALISRETVTADNYGPAVSVTTWILMVSVVLGVLLKVGLGVGARVAIGSDDATLIFATVKKTSHQNEIKSSPMLKPHDIRF